MNKWIRSADDSGTFIGVNDSSIYTFKERKYESLARESLQNSLDERLYEELPVRVEFKLFHIPVSDIPMVNQYYMLFEDCLDYWRNDKQENGRVFFEEALRLLRQPKITVLRISDFNTNGVLGSSINEIRSSEDITPWFNLIKSEGSSSKGETQGGSFGIGKNASFANSSLRTVFYSTCDREGINAYEGIAKLATVYKNNQQYAAKAFFGYEENGKSHAINELLNLEKNHVRDEFGTDIYILGFEDESDWELRMITSILSDFILPINNQDLEIVVNGEIINKKTLPSIYEKYIDYCKNNNTYGFKEELINSYNYYQILTSEKTMKFTKEFEGVGKAELKVLYSPDFDRKIMRTRETGMRLFSKGNISSSIGFSGIMTLEGAKLNKKFRKMENPAHTAWSADNVDNISEKKESKKLLKELDKWMRDTVLENAVDEGIETVDVAGLGDYLPIELSNDKSKNDKVEETVSDKINVITSYNQKREDVLKNRDMTNEKSSGQYNDNGFPGGVSEPTDHESKEKGGTGKNTDAGTSNEGETSIRKKVSKANFTTRLIRSQDLYTLLLTIKKNIEKIAVNVFVSGETKAVEIPIAFAQNRDTKEIYPIKDNKIKLENCVENMKIPLMIALKDEKEYALEVELYEY